MLKKKKQIVEKEKGQFPKISEVASCEIYYRKKLATISKESFSKDNLHKFYIWLAFNLSKSNALRPSSMGNMTIEEFNDCFDRKIMKIVCVEGGPFLNLFLNNKLLR